MILSAELAFTDFLNSQHPGHLMFERPRPPLAHIRERFYDDATEALTAALACDDRVGIALAFESSRAALDGLAELAGHGTARKKAA